MEKFVDKIIKFRWYIAIIIPIITLVMALNLKGLEFEGSYRIWFEENSKTLNDYDNFRATFGNDDAVTIAFKDKDGIFTKKSLKTIENITAKLWETKYIARVDSITNYQHIHSDKNYPDEIVVEDFIEDIDSYTSSDLLDKKEIALKQDLIVDRLISRDATTTMIVGRMTPKAGEDPAVSFYLRDALLQIIAPEIQKNGYEFHLNGGAIINTAFIEIAERDAKMFTPAVIAIVIVLFFVIFRRVSATVIGVLVVIFTFVIVLSIQTLLGFKLNNFTANIPVFVVAIGVADAMHLLWIYFIARKNGMQNDEAIHYSVSKNFLALLLTSLTTAVGFASLSISDVIPIKTLGIATASAAILAFVLTILFIPALLSIVNPKIESDSTSRDSTDDKKHPISTIYSKFILRYDRYILVGAVVLFSIIGAGLFKVNVDSNVVKYFKESVAFRADTIFLQKNLTGPMSYEIVIDSKKSDGIKDPDFMRMVEKFYGEFESRYSEVRHISSLIDTVKTFNEVMVGEKTIPDTRELIAQYLLFYSLSLPQGMEINDKMDIDERLLRVTASMDMSNSSKDIEMSRWVEEWWSKTEYSGVVEGQTVMFAHMQSDITNTLLGSITLAIVIISIMMLFIFKNLKMLPLFIVPNVLPIILVVGVMGWLGIDIDMGVAVAGAIIIGVAVDDTIHFMIKYIESRKRGDSLEKSMEYVMSYAGSAIIFTTIILSLAFFVFVFSEFNPNYHFGIVTVSALVIAVLVDLVALPALLSIVDNRKKSLLV